MNTACPNRSAPRTASSQRRTIHVSVPQHVEIDLRADSLWAADAEPNLKIECVSGEVWITQSGEFRDVILEPHQSFTPTHRGRVVVQALRPSRIAVIRG